MKQMIKSLTPPLFLSAYQGVRKLFRNEGEKRRDATVPPPPGVKQEYVKSYAARFGIASFVETGTYLGDMVNAVRKNFSEVYSIELSDDLYERVRHYFNDEKQVNFLHGDSGRLIAELTAKIDRPCLFWLDAHYSGGMTAQGDVDTPIMAELKHILQRKFADVILIDDARCFIGQDQYPTIEYVRDYVTKARPEYKVSVQDDIIFIHS